MKNLAVILAKSNSRRLPHKNVRGFLGKPIIQYSLDAIKETDLFDKVIVSSDDDDIGSFAAGHDAIYFKRSDKFTHDETPMVEGLLEVIRSERKTVWDNVCMVYACAPFVKAENIHAGLDKLGGAFDVVISAFKDDSHAEQAMLELHGRFVSRFPEYENSNSNDWPITYQSAGQFYWAKVDKLLQNKTLMPDRIGGVLVSEYEAIDIDTEEDWHHAELLYMAEHYQYDLDWIQRNCSIIAYTRAMEKRVKNGKIIVSYRDGVRVKCEAIENRMVEI